MIGNVSEQDFQQKVLDGKAVLVDFWAEWCGPCHMVAPVVEDIANEKGDTLQVAKLNIDDNPSTAQRYGVMSIPTLILFVGGEEKARIVGAQGKERILAQLDQHL
ncbi:MAG: thioredoxin [Actinomycetota bacterium]